MMKSMLRSNAYRVFKAGITTFPLVRAWRERQYEQKFANERWGKLFRGVYGSFAEAAASAPERKKIGYNHPEAAGMCKNCLVWIFPSDYPVLFWLSQFLKDGMRVFDFGGNLGNAYYTFRRYLRFPARLNWTVCDLPEVIKAGREAARRAESPGLSFTTQWEDGDGCDVMLISSVLQYIEEPLAQRLSRYAALPRILLLNKLPLRDGPGFITLQNIGTSFCPYQVYNRGEFIHSLNALGYELRDKWDNPEFRCHIPFHPDKHIRAYAGLCLERREP